MIPNFANSIFLSLNFYHITLDHKPNRSEIFLENAFFICYNFSERGNTLMQNTQLKTKSNEAFSGALPIFATIGSYFFLWLIASTLYFFFACIEFTVNIVSPLDTADGFLLMIPYGLEFLITSAIPLFLGVVVSAFMVALISYTIGRIRTLQWLIRLLNASIIGISTWLALTNAMNAYNNKITFSDLQSLLFPFWLIPVFATLMALAALIYSGTYHYSAPTED